MVYDTYIILINITTVNDTYNFLVLLGLQRQRQYSLWMYLVRFAWRPKDILAIACGVSHHKRCCDADAAGASASEGRAGLRNGECLVYGGDIWGW